MNLIAATLLSVLFLPALVAADPKTFTPDAVINPSAFYPEGPQLILGGILVAEMPKDRVVLLMGGKSNTVWSAKGCGPTSIKRIPSGGFWVLCHLGQYVVKLDDKFNTINKIDQTTSGRSLSWPNDGSVDSEGNLYLSSSGLFSLRAQPEGRVPPGIYLETANIFFLGARSNRSSLDFSSSNRSNYHRIIRHCR